MKNGFFRLPRKIFIKVLIVTACFFSINIFCLEQSAGEFIILNLHWNDGEISLNDIKKVNGLYKKQKKIHNSFM